MNTEEMCKALQGMVWLFESWRNGVFNTLGVHWTEDPPAIIAARLAIEHYDTLRCTGDQFTCPVGHDHP